MRRSGGKTVESGGHGRWAGIIAIVNNADLEVVITYTLFKFNELIGTLLSSLSVNLFNNASGLFSSQ